MTTEGRPDGLITSLTFSWDKQWKETIAIHSLTSRGMQRFFYTNEKMNIPIRFLEALGKPRDTFCSTIVVENVRN